MNKIHKERIKLWVKALRLAKKQTNTCLKNENGRCCLGVACDTYLKHAKNPKCKWKKSSKEFSFGDRLAFLPEVVQNWFGFESDDPDLIWNDTKYSASCLNDIYNFDFKEIADCVEETFLDE